MQYNIGSVDPQRAVEYKFQILKKKKTKQVLFWYLVRGLVLLSEVVDGRRIRG